MSIFLEKDLILGSNSPRRKEILSAAGFDFKVLVREIDESFSSQLKNEEIPLFLAKQKAKAFDNFDEKTLILTSDTVVSIENEILNKPGNPQEAKEMLQLLSNAKHTVFTACCLKDGDSYSSFFDSTDVYFKKLSQSEIDHYVEFYKPFDKAGAYGVQDFIGMIGIEKIEGSFYTVMGLPIHQVYKHLMPFISSF
jgi:septum formation protein